MAGRKITINRAPVMTLWAAVVAERLGYEESTALSLGKAVAGLNAQSKGRSIGIYRGADAGGEPTGKAQQAQEADMVTVLGRPVPVVHTPAGVRAAIKGEVVEPEPVQRYLESKFGEALEEARAAMRQLAAAYAPTELEDRAYGLYEKFRPVVAKGKRGWGAAGELDLGLLKQMATRRE